MSAPAEYVLPGWWLTGYAEYEAGAHPFTPLDTVASQYANSDTLLQLISNYDQTINPAADFQQFVDWIWNINTARGFGLDIWGRIIGVARQVNAPAIYGFPQPAGPYSMLDEQYRRVLLIKALANISNGSVPDINRQLRMLSNGRGNAYVQDLGDMHLKYTFLYAPDPYEYAVISSYRVVTKPLGVGAGNSFTVNPYFGFSEAESWNTFDAAVFAAY